MAEPQILVVDFGSQTSHLICRRLRDNGVYAQIAAPQTPVLDCGLANIRGLIFSGSPFSVYAAAAPQPHEQILALSTMVPTLGICYGLHWLARHLGGQVEALERKEYGPNPVEILKTDSPLLQGIGPKFVSWMSHADSLKVLPPGFELLARSEQGLPAIIASAGGGGALYGLQFHPEVSHCEFGQQFLVNFARAICDCQNNWTLESWEPAVATEIRQQLGPAPVVLLISGGVDSSVTAALLLKYLPAEQVHLLYVDTGLMRLGESGQVVEQLTRLGARHVHQLDARREFVAALAGVCDPEKKRSIIGDCFIRVQEQEISRLFQKENYFLAQGTLYTDMIESGMGEHAAVIKSHHNVSAPLVLRLRREKRLVEPLATLYKDEVRRLGENLGLGRDLTQRQPFPGPGLAIRVLGEVTEEKLELLRSVDDLYLETLRELQVYHEIWQAFAVLLPVQSVGVTGDSRRYGPVIALRAITSIDGMSAEVYPFRPEQLQKISTQISNRFAQISRVVYDISAKPPATIEWE